MGKYKKSKLVPDKVPTKIKLDGGAELKRGRLSDKDKAFIRKYAGEKSDEWIGQQIKRNAITVAEERRLIQATLKIQPVLDQEQTEDAMLVERLHARDDWPMMKTQYTEKELRLFEFYWCRSMKQMQDLPHTEEMQVIKLINFEMTMHAILAQKHKTTQEIDKVMRLLDAEHDKLPDHKDTDQMMLLEQILSAHQANEQYKTKEYNDVFERYNKLLSSLKATRDQRMAHVENSQFKFADWIRRHNEDKVRKAESQEMELMKVATDFEKQRLGELHEYEDGTVDQVFLNCDTVLATGEDNDGHDAQRATNVAGDENDGVDYNSSSQNGPDQIEE